MLPRIVLPGGVPLCHEPTEVKQMPLKALLMSTDLGLQDLLCQGEPRDSSDSWEVHKSGVLRASDFLGRHVYQKIAATVTSSEQSSQYTL